MVEFITLQGLDGRLAHIAVKQIVSISEAKPGERVTPGVRCVVYMTDGKFLTIVESCDSVRKRMRGE